MSGRFIPPALVTATAPCRIDCGGTLDIAPLSLGLAAHRPATFNIALALRTKVRVRPNPGGGIEVNSTGFESEAATNDHDYTTPLGFFIQAADHFGLKDLTIDIDSASPPRSALGGSSVALVAAVAALAASAPRRKMNRAEIVRLAHRLEEALFMVPCGRQDQLAAAYGGVHQWAWDWRRETGWRKTKLISGPHYGRLERRLLIAYPGQTHSSADVNGTWVREFTRGSTRPVWRKIIAITRKLARAVAGVDWKTAAACLNKETDLRLEMTPEVLTDTGLELVTAARRAGVGARFTGAGGGGCLWALGPMAGIETLKPVWSEILAPLDTARLLPATIDRIGLTVVRKRGPVPTRD